MTKKNPSSSSCSSTLNRNASASSDIAAKTTAAAAAAAAAAKDNDNGGGGGDSNNIPRIEIGANRRRKGDDVEFMDGQRPGKKNMGKHKLWDTQYSASTQWGPGTSKKESCLNGTVFFLEKCIKLPIYTSIWQACTSPPSSVN